MVGRYEYDIRKMALAVKPFRSWCVKHQINFAATVDSLVKSNDAETKKVRWGKGTHMNIPPVMSVVLNFDFDFDAALGGGTNEATEEGTDA